MIKELKREKTKNRKMKRKSPFITVKVLQYKQEIIKIIIVRKN